MPEWLAALTRWCGNALQEADPLMIAYVLGWCNAALLVLDVLVPFMLLCVAKWKWDE